MTSPESKTEEKLKDVGNSLLQNSSSSVDQLLTILDKLEQLLSTVEQAPDKPVHEALLPSMEALISRKLLRHSNEDVKITVISCITEITRITAPDAPYNDEQMKEIFELTVAAFENLAHVSGRCYEKAVLIIDNVARVKSCVIMLDLECDDLVIEMFQRFLRIIRSNHPLTVVLAMESIMTLVLHESEEISSDLLRPLLESVRKENQTISPISWTLGEKVIANCAVKLKPYLMNAVQCTGRALDDYAQIVTYICQNGSEALEHDHLNGSRNNLVQADVNTVDVSKDADEQSLDVTKGPELDMTCARDVAQVRDDTKSTVKDASASTMKDEIIIKECSKGQQHSNLTVDSKSDIAKPNSETGNFESVKEPKSETELDAMPKKRGRRPNSLMNPEEGYDHSWIFMGKKTAKPAQFRKVHDSSTDFLPSENPASGKDKLLSRPEYMREALVSRPKTDENTDAVPATNLSIPTRSCPKRGRPKKRISTGSQGVDPNSVSVLKEDHLKPLLEETSLESPGVRLERDSEVAKDAEVKPQASLKRNKLAAKTDETSTVAPESVVDEMEPRVSCEDEQNPKSPMITEAENIENVKSLAQTDSRKRRQNDTSNKDLNESSASKELIAVSATKTLDGVEETPQTRLRRRRNAASGTRNNDDPLVGSRIKVWWPMDKKFYEGIVNSYDSVKAKHKILYADGDVEVLNLEKQRWELITDDVSTDVERGIDLQKLEEASDIAQKGKEKSNRESAKGANLKFRFKRGRASASISESESVKSAGKPVDTAVDEPVVADESMVGPPKTDNGQDSAGKSNKESAVGTNVKFRFRRGRASASISKSVSVKSAAVDEPVVAGESMVDRPKDKRLRNEPQTE